MNLTNVTPPPLPTLHTRMVREINTCNGKKATNDLLIFAKNYTSLIMLE